MKHLLIAAALFLQLSAPGQALIVDYTKTVCPGSEMTVKLVADPGIVWVTIWTTEWPISYPIEFPFDADTLIVQLAVPDFFSGQCWIYSYNTDQKYQPVILTCAAEINGVPEYQRGSVQPSYYDLLGNPSSPEPGRLLIEQRGSHRQKIVIMP